MRGTPNKGEQTTKNPPKRVFLMREVKASTQAGLRYDLHLAIQ
jgi:hypothetical protein